MSRRPDWGRLRGARVRAGVARRLRRLRRSPLSQAGRQWGWGDPGLRQLLDDLDDALRRGQGPPRLAVLGRPDSPDWASLVRSVFPRAFVTVVTGEDGDRRTHARLAALGRYHAILDDTLQGASRVPDLQDVFLHLRLGGALLVRRPEGEDRGAWASLESEVAQHVDDPDPRANRGRGWRPLPAAVDTVTVGRHHVAITNRRRAVAKLHEDELDLVLATRPKPPAVVLRTLPSTELRARCDFRENKPFRDDKMPDVYAVPPMSVRVHDNVLCAPRQVAVQGNLALPDSFRWNADPVLRNRFLSDLGPRFAPDPAEGRRPRRLEGTYFYFDSEWTNHFGHAITEQLSRLWAVPAAREHDPDLKVLLDRRNGRTDISSYELEILQAVGFTRDDIVLHHRPVRVERLVAASPMWVLPRHVHPDIGRLWQDIGQRIADHAQDAPSWPRIFVSRRRDRRSCLNRPEVEQLFSSHGFEIVHPEELPFPAQVKMFRSAEVIAGFSGSGMFNMQFCDTPRHAIVLSPTSYPSRNEYMISAVVGHRLDYVWSPPDPVQARGPEPRYAGFTFDFQDEGVFLEHVLAGL